MNSTLCNRRRGRVGGGSPPDRLKLPNNIDDEGAFASQRAKVASNFSSSVVAALVLVGLLSKTSKTFERRRRFRLRDVEPVRLLRLVLVLVLVDDDDDDDLESLRVAAEVELERGTE